MRICCLLLSVVPFYSAIAVACYVFIDFFRFPLQSSAWIAWESGGAANIHNFSLSDIVNFDLSITASSSHIIIILMNFESKDLSINITKKVDYSWLIMRVVDCIKGDLARLKEFDFGVALNGFE